jgi:hypothetical protein
MNHKTMFSCWFSVLGFTLLLGCSIAFSQSRSWNPGEPVAENLAEHGEFIAAFDWSVERSRNFVWPFESLKPAPFDSVWMVVERMPRAWPEKGGGKTSVPLSAYRCLQVNGGSLPKPQRVTDSQKEFRISLEQGRLRFSFSLPSGFRLDSHYTLIRIKLYRVSKQHNRVSPTHARYPPTAMRSGTESNQIGSRQTWTAENLIGIVQISNAGKGRATQNFVDLSTNQNQHRRRQDFCRNSHR